MEEVGEFPFVCEECLGPDPYVRMIKSKFGAACKLTTRPFTSFKWRVRGSANGAWRHTQICIEIAKLKNCCQVCLRDMTYLVPMSLRDSVMKSNPYNVQLPSSFAGQQYFLDRKAREQEQLSNGASSFSQNALPPPPPPPPAAMLQNQFVGQPQLGRRWMGSLLSEVHRWAMASLYAYYRPTTGWNLLAIGQGAVCA